MKVFTALIILLSGQFAKAQMTNADSIMIHLKSMLAEMVLVEGGTLQMGSSDWEKNEQPVHIVTLNSFYIGKYEVTQSLWKAIMGDDPSKYAGCADCPVEQVPWKRIQQFLTRLNKLSGKNYRLPTEAEWEYAALGGNKTKGYAYSGSNDLAEVGWFATNAGGRTHPVGLKKPNELGLYDMSGNVWEMCIDWFSSNYYQKSPAANPKNEQPGMFRVVRGGSWRSPDDHCRSKARNRNVHDHHIGNGGFRLVLDK